MKIEYMSDEYLMNMVEAIEKQPGEAAETLRCLFSFL